MNSSKELQNIYMLRSNNKYNIPIALEDLNESKDIVKIIENFLNENPSNKFKLEFLMYPSWVTPKKTYSIFHDKYTHIKIKSSLI